jgi:hypothetical protein
MLCKAEMTRKIFSMFTMIIWPEAVAFPCLFAHLLTCDDSKTTTQLKIQVFWEVTHCHWARSPQYFMAL